MYPYFVEAIVFSEFQVIPVTYIVRVDISREMCKFIWTYLTYFLPFSSLTAMSWIDLQIQFFISSCTILQYPCAYNWVRWVLDNTTYVLQDKGRHAYGLRVTHRKMQGWPVPRSDSNRCPARDQGLCHCQSLSKHGISWDSDGKMIVNYSIRFTKGNLLNLHLVLNDY